MAQHLAYSSCRLVKGYNAFLIYDLLRIKIYYVTLNLGNYLLKKVNYNSLTAEEVSKLNWLTNNEIVYDSSVYSNIKLNKKTNLYKESALITNIIIEYSDSFLHSEKYSKIISLIEFLHIKNIQIIVNKPLDTSLFYKFINAFSHTVVYHIEIVFLNQPTNTILKKLCLNDRIQNIIIVKEQIKPLMTLDKISFVSTQIYLKGMHPIKFSVNKLLFDESQEVNTYFYKKMYINGNGELYSAPEYTEGFGNVFEKSNVGILEIINTKEFQKHWNVKKDECNICMDCEFRYACVDNRLPYFHANGYWSHNVECNYNPYTNTWKTNE